MRSAIVAHRDLARAIFARIPFGENALRGSEWMIGVLREGGLPDQVVAYACDLLPMYVTAVAYEASLYASESVTPEVMEQFVADMRSYLESLPPERFPRVVGARRRADQRGGRRAIRVRARRAGARARRDGRVSGPVTTTRRGLPSRRSPRRAPHVPACSSPAEGAERLAVATCGSSPQVLAALTDRPRHVKRKPPTADRSASNRTGPGLERARRRSRSSARCRAAGR